MKWNRLLMRLHRLALLDNLLNSRLTPINTKKTKE